MRIARRADLPSQCPVTRARSQLVMHARHVRCAQRDARSPSPRMPPCRCTLAGWSACALGPLQGATDRRPEALTDDLGEGQAVPQVPPHAAARFSAHALHASWSPSCECSCEGRQKGGACAAVSEARAQCADRGCCFHAEVVRAALRRRWKLVHGDVFRAPRALELLAALVGTGVQLALLVLSVILITIAGARQALLHPSPVVRPAALTRHC